MARISTEAQARIETLADLIEKQYIEAGVLREKALEEATGIIMRSGGSADSPKVGKKRGPKAGKKREPDAAKARKKFTADLDKNPPA